MSEFFDFLLAGLNHGERLVQARAAALLGELGDSAAVEPLIKYVTQSRYFCKTAGIHALGELLSGDEPQVETICELADEPNCENDWYWFGCKGVRAAASLTLLRVGEAYGERYLGELADKDDTVFYAWYAPAILALEPDEPCVKRLQKRLTIEAMLRPEKANATRVTDPESLAVVAEAIGLLGSDEALLALRNLMIFRSRYVRGAAAVALATADPDAPSEAAIERMAAEPNTEYEAIRGAEAMCLIGRKGWTERLTALAAVRDDFNRYAAVSALARVDEEVGGDERTTAVFTKALADAAPAVRVAAIEALDNCGAIDDLAPIAALYANDPDMYVRLQAAAMLALRNGAE